MSWYKTGSVTATSGSKIITGAGTQFTNPLNGVSAGRMLLLPGSGTVQIYEIESVQSDTQLTLVSAFAGVTGSGKLYAVPASPSVSIEQFAHEFASTLAYYQQQLQGWQSILTGSGNITLTTPDGQVVTVRSQAEWDRLLNTKMGAGQFGWGGRAINIGSGVNLFDYFTRDRPAGLYWVNQTGINRPPGFADCVLFWNPIQHDEFYACLLAIGFTTGGAMVASISANTSGWENAWTVSWDSKNLQPMTSNTNQTVTALKTYKAEWASTQISPETLGGPSYYQGIELDGSARWYLGYANPQLNRLTLYNLKGGAGISIGANGDFNIDAPSVSFTQSKGFVRNYRAALPEFANVTELLASWRGEQSMGSAVTNDNFVWRSFISVRHRGGNSNGENGATDSGDWGFVFLDDNMTGAGHNFRIIKMRAGVWDTGVDLYHTGNTTADANGFLKVASPVVKLFSTGTSELNTESEGITTERIERGVYRISGCLGMNSDLAWGGIDGGIVGPRCRNGLERLWIDYDVESDGSIVIRTYHRTHPSAMTFARNELNGYEEGDAIDIPTDTFLSIRVQMPAQEETPYVPVVKTAANHSNVYCNTISPA